MFLYIIPFENLDQFILKFGFIYLGIKLNVLSSIDAIRWKLVFYSIEIIVLDGIHPTSPYDGCRCTGKNILQSVLFCIILHIIQDSRDFDGRF